MTTAAANTAVRERRRRSTQVDIEQMDIMKALTAAEYSRRQFVLNYAASRDTKLLVPGQKADTIKQAEEWVAQWMNQSGYSTIGNDCFKYTVDERLWTTLGNYLPPSIPPSLPHASPLTNLPVGTDIPFPFAFMRQLPEVVISELPTGDPQAPQHINPVDLQYRARPKSEAFLPDLTTVEVRLLEDATKQPSPPTAKDGKLSRTTTNNSNSTPLSAQQTETQSTPTREPQRRASLMSSGRRKKKSSPSGSKGSPPGVQTSSAVMSAPLLEKKRSMSLTSLEDLKLTRRTSAQERFPFLVRWGRSWGRRTSA